MRSMMWATAAALTLAACGETQQQNVAEEAAPASLQPGEYELTTKVDQIRSTDGATPATSLKADAAATTTRACIPADGSIDPAMFAESSDECTVTERYVKNGRMSVQLRCTRSGQSGPVMQLIDGDFKADSFEAKVLGSTLFSGSGDYEMTRSVTAKRVGDCPAAAAAQ